MIFGLPNTAQMKAATAQIRVVEAREMRACEYCGGRWTKEPTWSEFARKDLMRPAAKCECCGAGRN